ncbi:ECF transporter S component [Cutibacterium equinum]|uniref:ECF transporter S component n=1 Tax=Cutibacterium equinum TaxID=3016342 RepID=A0ABY7QZY9_9ACTN|nr:ECF transporter S component [Cutibacterium equinum]WCC80089.1 ECF transporter S component [Cutibacterium equinum]
MTNDKPAMRYRTIDIVTPVMIAVAFGVIFLGYSALYSLLKPVTSVYLPAEGSLSGIWFLPALIAGLIVRKPGAPLLAELLAASIEAALGGQWGVGTLISGVLQSLPMELCLLAVAYRKAGPKLAIVAGALTGLVEGVYERISYYPMFRFGDTVVYAVLMIISGALLGGLVAWGIVRGLAAAGALNTFAVSRDLRGTKTVKGATSPRNLS